jgi:endonuclease/exonuclease/phosphatase family metal-dependent hydrolase
MHSEAESVREDASSDSADGGVERGEFAEGASDAPPGRGLVVATFNIRYAVGSRLISGSIMRRMGLARPARRSSLVGGNLGRAASLLRDGRLMPAADVIAIQEADRRTTRAGGRHVARELAELSGMNYAHAAMRVPRGVAPRPKQWYLDFEEIIGTDDAGDTGVSLLSRLPLEGVRRIELPRGECPWRPHLALAATVSLRGKNLRVFNAHIDPHGSLEARLAQHRAVVAEADKGSPEDPTVLLGDFNTLTREARDATRRLLEAHGFSTPMPSGTATWRAGLVRLHTDWIFVRNARIKSWGVARQRGVSDHWPVWAEVDPTDD